MLLALAAVAAGCARDTSPEALSAAASEAQAGIEAYVEALNAMDFDSAGTFYSPSGDFQWIEQGEIRYRSAEESRESLAGLGAMASSATLTLSDLTLTALGPDAAVATCHFLQEIGIDGGAGFAFAGAMTIVLRREGGRWLFVSGHTSSPPADSDDEATVRPGDRG